MPRKCQLPQAAASALAGAPGGRCRALSAVVAPRLCQGGVSDPGKDPSAVSGWDESPGGADRALCAGQGSGRPHRSPLKGSQLFLPTQAAPWAPIVSPTQGSCQAAVGARGAQQGKPSTPCLPLTPFSSPPARPQALAWMVGPALLLLLALPAGAWRGLGLPRRPCVQCCRPAWPPAAPGPGAHVSDGDTWAGLPRLRPTIDISILKGECTRRGGLLCPWPYRDTYAEGRGQGAPRGQWMGACSLLSMATPPPGGQRVSWGRGCGQGA